MSNFKDPTKAAEAGRKSKRGPSLTTIILKKTKGGNLLIDTLIAIVKDTKARNLDRISAATKLLEYGFGKPVQQVDANVDGSFVFRWEGDEISES